ncbi:MBL fold metallo-hydrolase [Natranaeroarchaeum aerophilus]|uniref:MBL fold metallo-hydrolase n=1 Tax=Natranaeroarchaeum aerophilus TaxID=2917711 RepID=A0AAE3FQ69_9EURY|nr:MBL fold metallo-hydrolase [Natranaeroarchaeum aerophilus]MCL9813090.1 MBL fold metallo-hydrolase [Natranaeroarchaeum aerophilus]
MVTNIAQGVQAFTSNAFLVPGDRTVLVDTGANFDAVGKLRERVDALDAVVLTHTHQDHIDNLPAITDAFDVETWGYDVDQPAVDAAIADEETVTLGDDKYVALHTPGHKNDHLCFYSAAGSQLFAGDLVFQNGAFGRTDLPEGDRELLVESIDRVLDRVDNSLSELHVGHGPSITNEPYSQIERSGRMARER